MHPRPEMVKPFSSETKTIALVIILAIVIVLIIIGAASGGGNSKSDEPAQEPATAAENSSSNENTVAYTLTGGEVGEYGSVITLNADTDMPVDKYLYKLPAGTYTVTTTYDGLASFFIVKDEPTIEEGNTEYPEILDYVGTGEDGKGYLLTAGSDDFNGKASNELTVTIGEDESVQIPGTQTFIFELQ